MDLATLRSKYASGLVVDDQSLARYNSFLTLVRPGWTLETLAEQLLQQKKVIRVMDIGCGSGRALSDLKSVFGSRLTTIGIDAVDWPSKVPIDQFCLGNLVELEIPSSIDLLISFRSLHEIGQLSVILPRLVGCLAIGGLAILSIRLHYSSANGAVFREGVLTPDDVNYVQSLVQSPERISGAHIVVVPTLLPANQLEKDWGGATLLIERTR